MGVRCFMNSIGEEEMKMGVLGGGGKPVKDDSVEEIREV